MRSAASAAPTAAGTPDGGEQEGAAGDPQEVDHLVRAGDEAAAGRQRLAERAHPQVDVRLDAEQLRSAGAARAEDAGARAPRRPSAARRRPGRARRSAAAGRCRPPSRRRRRRPPARRRRPHARAGASSRACRAGCAGTGAAWRARSGSRRGSTRGRRSRRSPCRRGRGSSRACRRWPGGRWRRRSPPRCPSTPRARASSSRWRSSVPLSSREPVRPVPYLSSASRAACCTRGSAVSPR